MGKTAGKNTFSAVRDTSAVTKLEAGFRRRLESVPFLSRAIGGPGAYEKEQKKRREDSSKGMADLSKENLQKTIEMRDTDPKVRAEAMKIAAEKGWLKEEYQKHVSGAILHGIPAKTIYKKMPHWAKTAIDTRKIIEDQAAGEFAKDMDASLLVAAGPPATPGGPKTYTDKQLAAFYAMDLDKIKSLGRQGADKRKAVAKFLDDNMTEINHYITTLRASGLNDEANKINLVKGHILVNANYKF